MPVHLGNHWTCAVIDLPAQELVYYDSMGVRFPTLPPPTLRPACLHASHATPTHDTPRHVSRVTRHLCHIQLALISTRLYPA